MGIYVTSIINFPCCPYSMCRIWCRGIETFSQGLSQGIRLNISILLLLIIVSFPTLYIGGSKLRPRSRMEDWKVEERAEGIGRTIQDSMNRVILTGNRNRFGMLLSIVNRFVIQCMIVLLI
jgi:hypothetical protein